jgi:hypothetical protein
MIEDIKKIIELSPARQAQVCYDAKIQEGLGKITVTLEPTLEHFLLERTGDRDMIGLYSSMVFHAGITVGSIEYWCRENNKRFDLNLHIPEEPTSDLYSNFFDVISSNKNFIIDETVAYLEYLNDNKRISIGEIYVYDPEKCVRDLNFLMDAILFDLNYDTNQRTVQIMKEFWCNGRKMVRGVAEQIAYKFIKDLVSHYVSQNLPAESYQKIKRTQQILLDKQVENKGLIKFNLLLDQFAEVVDKGLDYVPEVYNPFPRSKDKIEVIIYE